MRIIIAISALFVVGCTTVYVDPDKSLAPDANPGGNSDAADLVTHGQKTMFVSSATYEGELLGGLVGADATCAARASAAGLPGTFKAWLSSSSTSAASRLTHSTDAYVLVDGTQVAASWDGLVSGTLAHAIDLDETGHASTTTMDCVGHQVVAVWTGTLVDGTAGMTNAYCNDWATNDSGLSEDGLLGDAQSSDSFWTDIDCANACDSMASLYCVAQ